MNLQKRDERLKEFTEKLKKKGEILAVYYTGSTASKEWDEYSNIDIDIVVSDEDYDETVDKLPDLLSLWKGEVKLINNYPGQDETYAFLGDNYEKVEIDPIKLSELEPSPELKDIRVGFDKTGKLEDIISKSNKLSDEPEINEEEFKNVLLDIRATFIYIARHFARGQKLSAASEFGEIGGKLFSLLSKLKKVKQYELLRDAEKLLTKKEWELLKASCDGITKKDIKNAVNDFWKYIEYIENKFEQETGEKLELDCDDEEILDLVNKTLEEA